MKGGSSPGFSRHGRPRNFSLAKGDAEAKACPTFERATDSPDSQKERLAAKTGKALSAGIDKLARENATTPADAAPSIALYPRGCADSFDEMDRLVQVHRAKVKRELKKAESRR